MAVAKDQAVELVDANRRADAAKELREKAAMLKSMGETYSNSAILDLAKTSTLESERLERDGLPNAARKTYRAETMQTKNQQATSYSSSGGSR
jgi:hypothetical protein